MLALRDQYAFRDTSSCWRKSLIRGLSSSICNCLLVLSSVKAALLADLVQPRWSQCCFRASGSTRPTGKHKTSLPQRFPTDSLSGFYHDPTTTLPCRRSILFTPAPLEVSPLHHCLAEPDPRISHSLPQDRLRLQRVSLGSATEDTLVWMHMDNCLAQGFDETDVKEDVRSTHESRQLTGLWYPVTRRLRGATNDEAPTRDSSSKATGVTRSSTVAGMVSIG